MAAGATAAQYAMEALGRQGENTTCINCNALGPSCIVTDFKIFVCAVCSDVHRNLGHRVKCFSRAADRDTVVNLTLGRMRFERNDISDHRDVSRDVITDLDVKGMQEGGNQVAMATYLKEWTRRELPRPTDGEEGSIRSWIRYVFENKYFFSTMGDGVTADSETESEDDDEGDHDGEGAEAADKMFHCFDQDGAGVLSKNELDDMLKLMGHQLSQEELKELMEAIDADGNGKVDLQEFGAWFEKEGQAFFTVPATVLYQLPAIWEAASALSRRPGVGQGGPVDKLLQHVKRNYHINRPAKAGQLLTCLDDLWQYIQSEFENGSCPVEFYVLANLIDKKPGPGSRKELLGDFHDYEFISKVKLTERALKALAKGVKASKTYFVQPKLSAAVTAMTFNSVMEPAALAGGTNAFLKVLCGDEYRPFPPHVYRNKEDNLDLAFIPSFAALAGNSHLLRMIRRVFPTSLKVFILNVMKMAECDKTADEIFNPADYSFPVWEAAAIAGSIECLDEYLGDYDAGPEEPVAGRVSRSGKTIDMDDAARRARFTRCAMRSESVCALAAAGGHLEFLQHARSKHLPWGPMTLTFAAALGRTEVLAWLLSAGCPSTESACTAAAAAGQLRALQLLRESGCAWSSRTCLAAAYKGMLYVLQWARHNGCPWDYHECLKAATDCGHGDVATWIQQHKDLFMESLMCFGADVKATYALSILAPLVEMWPELQLFFTMAGHAFNGGQISRAERNHFVHKALEAAAPRLAVCDTTKGCFTTALDYARRESMITDVQRNILEAKACKCHIGNADFITDMQSLLRSHEASIGQLMLITEAQQKDLQALQKSVSSLRHAFVQQIKNKQVMGQVKMVLTGITMAVSAGTLGLAAPLAAAGNGVIDFINGVVDLSNLSLLSDMLLSIDLEAAAESSMHAAVDFRFARLEDAIMRDQDSRIAGLQLLALSAVAGSTTDPPLPGAVDKSVEDMFSDLGPSASRTPSGLPNDPPVPAVPRKGSNKMSPAGSATSSIDMAPGTPNASGEPHPVRSKCAVKPPASQPKSASDDLVKLLREHGLGHLQGLLEKEGCSDLESMIHLPSDKEAFLADIQHLGVTQGMDKLKLFKLRSTLPPMRRDHKHPPEHIPARAAEQTTEKFSERTYACRRQSAGPCFDTLKNIQGALQNQPVSAEVAEKACAAVGTMCVGNEDNKAKAGRQGLLKDLQRALKSHSKSAGVAEKACAGVHYICVGNEDNKSEAGRLGLLKDLQDALKTHPKSPGVVQHACKTVGILCSNSQDSKVEAGRLGLLKDLQEALKSNVESRDVAEQACRVVRILCLEDINQARAGRLGLLKDLQRALKSHPMSVGIAEQACAAVETICVGNEDAKAAAGQLGLLKDLQDALKTHPKSPGVAEHACAAVGILCSNSQDCKVEAGRLGLLKDLQEALKSNVESSGVAEQACRVVRLLCLEDINQARAERLGLLKDLQRALKSHPMSVGIAEQACAAVENICVGNEDAKAAAGQLGLLKDLQDALKTHYEWPGVAEHACAAVGILCSNSNDNKAEAGRLGLLKDLQKALKSNLESSGVAEQACRVVRILCLDINNSVRAGRLGLLKDLQKALKSHPESAGVVEQACAAMGIMCVHDNENRAEAKQLGLLNDLWEVLNRHPELAGRVAEMKKALS